MCMWSLKNKHKSLMDEIYAAAIEGAVQASNHILEYWPHPLNINFSKDYILKVFKKHKKGPGNYSTIPDKESESLIIKRIKQSPRLRDHGILAEESENKNTTSRYQWIIDPIDGTQNFRNGLPDFGVSIGVLIDNQPWVGVIAMPVLGHIIAAVKGEGVKLFSFDGRELLDPKNIKYEMPLENAMVAYDTGYETRVEQIKKVYESIADNIGYLLIYCSSSVANYRVAMGHLGGFFHESPTKYDIAAASVILSEAGGVVSDINGNPIDWTAEEVTYLGARTPEIHKKLLKLLSTKEKNRKKK